MSVAFEVRDAGSGTIAIATLDSEKSLNSLSLQMIESLHAKLQEWATDETIYGVVICGKGKAFCAGGDIRALYQSMVDKTSYGQEFFEKEYRLDAYIYSYPKPLLVWAHGITMGGGMGVMQGAQFRIVTDSTRMAMPELTIGLFPDVGASYFLKEVPNHWGLFLGLTGVRMKACDAVTLNLADYWLPDDAFEKCISALSTSNIDNEDDFEYVLKDFLSRNARKEEDCELLTHKAFVETVLRNTSALQLMNWAKTYTPKDDWEKILITNIQKACPTSLGLIYALWEKGKKWEAEDAFYYEWFVAAQCTVKGDFKEGVRALLIDKDNNPQWKPATPEELTADYIESHFVSPRADGTNPLTDIKGA